MRVCSQRAELFRRVMPATFENLAIAQHRDTLQYAIIRGGGYRPSICKFHVGDYVYLQWITSTTLDVMIGYTITSARGVSFWSSHVGGSSWCCLEGPCA